MQGLVNSSPRTRVVRSIRSSISKGRYADGEKLPAENDIAQSLGVSRGTVRSALEDLEKQGLIRTVRNCGRVVTYTSRREDSVLSKTVVMLSAITENPALYAESGKMWAVEAGVFDAARVAGLNAMYMNDSAVGSGELDRIIAARPYGIVVSHSTVDSEKFPEILPRLGSAGVPVVVNGDGIELEKFNRIISDQETGAYLLAKKLIAAGARRILRVWTNQTPLYWVRNRNAGYEKAMKEAGIQPLRPVLTGCLTPRMEDSRENFERRTREYAGYLAEHLSGKNAVDALMLMNDSDAYPAAAACRLFKKIPNRDVVIAGYDNFWRECPESRWEKEPPAVTVDKCNFETGRKMFELLSRTRDGSVRAGGVLVKVESRIINIKDI